MSAATHPDPAIAGPEAWADWCATGDDLSFCGTRMREYSRTSMGERWCFHHRRRHPFDRVVMVPDGLSYYGPSLRIEGEAADCTDLFPGWYREWDED